MALTSVDLSAAFHNVDVGWLIRRLTIIGLPLDGVNLIEIWLKGIYSSS